jgi:hypothetical protein
LIFHSLPSHLRHSVAVRFGLTTGDATLHGKRRALSPSDSAATGPKRQSKQKTNQNKRFSRQETSAAGAMPAGQYQALLPASSKAKRMFTPAHNPPRSARLLPRQPAVAAASLPSAVRLLPVNDCRTLPLPFGQPPRKQPPAEPTATHAPTLLTERPVT